MAAPGRAYWKGFLRLSLVSIGVAVYNAVDTTAEIKFNQIHKPSGKRINYTKTVKGIGPVEAADIVKAYEVDENTYVTLEPEELNAIKLESTKTLDLQQFVGTEEMDPRYFERPYYIVPVDDHAVEGYLVIRDALKKSGKLGVGQVTMSGREYLVAVGPLDRGLGMHIMRYADEMQVDGAIFRRPAQREARSRNGGAGERADRPQGRRPSSPSNIKNRYATALHELVKEKAKGDKIVAAKEERPTGTNVVDLMDALETKRQRRQAGESASCQGRRRRGGEIRGQEEGRRRPALALRRLV